MSRLLLTMLLIIPAFPVCAAGVGGMFGLGRNHFSLVAGSGSAFDKNYFVIGASVTHYVRDGFGVGLSVEKWSGSDPGITKYSPFAQYVFFQSSWVQPYVGGFYRHTSVSGLSGINSVGGRVGAYFAYGSHTYASVGIVHESYLDCRQSVYRTCTSTYPDIGLTAGF